MNTNPYAPPSAVVERPRAAASIRSRVPLVLVFVIISVAAYVGFTMLLLTSTAVDRQIGFVFLINIPVMVFWVVTVWRTARFGAVFGVASAVTQGLITAIILSRGIGDAEAVYAISGGIVLVILALSAVCWFYHRRAK